MHILVLMTSHNRRQKTIECLDALFLNCLPDGAALDVVLVDDGSTDGTAEAVQERFPSVMVSRGDGSLFWNRGMHRAEQIATRADPDFFIWLNDDTNLHADAIVRMFRTYTALLEVLGHPVLVVGGTVDPTTHKLTYGGLVSVGRVRRFKYRKVWSAEEWCECEAMNGNLVLVPRVVAERLGNIDPAYEHAMGDIDYALRARKAGYRVFVAAGVMGYCSNNSVDGSHADQNLSFKTRWTKFTSRKGLPPGSWLHFVRRHGGWFWPAYFWYPYANFTIRTLSAKTSSQLIKWCGIRG